MIGEILDALKSDLDGYLRSFSGTSATEDIVGLGNPAFLDDSSTTTPSRSIDTNLRIVISVVNVEEEARLKQGESPIGERNPPVHLVLYLLFCASSMNYKTALNDLGRVVSFFQFNSQLRFEVTNGSLPPEPAILRFDLHTLSFSQINDLWGSLGGKQIPFVMYKASVVRIQSTAVEPEPVIHEIRLGIQG